MMLWEFNTLKLYLINLVTVQLLMVLWEFNKAISIVHVYTVCKP